MDEHPVRVTVTDDLQRNRWTVFFRVFLVIPHFIWLALWGIAVFFAAFVNWLITLIDGTPPRPLFDFLAAYVRYATHVYAYILFAANPYPAFTGEPGYPVDVDLGGPVRQNRWKTGFRIVLALPALALTDVLVGGAPSSWDARTRGGGGDFNYQTTGGGVAVTLFVLGWFAILFRGRMPQGFRDLVAYCLRYAAQTYAYVFVLTDRYPDADPALPEAVEPAPPSPVRLTLDDDPHRSRLTVFFRVFLALPHLVWLVLWSIASFFALIAIWVSTSRQRPSGGWTAPLPLRLPPLRRPRVRVPVPDRRPVPRLRRAPRQLSGRPRAARAGGAGTLGRVLPARARGAGLRRLRSARRGARLYGGLRLVLLARHGA